MDVAYISQCEDQWVGQAVVARNNEHGHFELGNCGFIAFCSYA